MAMITRVRVLRAAVMMIGGTVAVACGGADQVPGGSTPAGAPSKAATTAAPPTVQAVVPTAAPTAAPLPSGPYPYKMTSATYFAAGERLEWVTTTAEEFNRVNSGRITVENLQITGNYAEGLITSVAAGTAPDVARTSGQWFSDFADKGSLVEFGQYVKRDKLDLALWYQQDEMLFRKGKQFAMPFWQAHSVYLFNRNLFDKNGVRPPDNETWTWNELLDAAQRLTKPGESFGIQMGNGFEFAWLNFVRSAGEDYINKERTRTTLNTPTNVEVFGWLVDLYQKYKVHPVPDDKSLGEGDLWLQGKIGMRLGGTGIVGSTLNAKPSFDWDMFVTPKYPKTGVRGITANENSTVSISQTKNPEASYTLAKFYSEKFAQDLLGRLRINSPTLRSAAADPAGWLATPPASMKLVGEQMRHAGTLSFHLNWLQWYNEITKQMLPAFRGEISTREACDKASQVGDTFLRGA